MTNHSNDLQIAKKAASAAADIIQSYQQDKSFGISFKGRNDMVTEADIAAEEKIMEIITENFPDDQILAEETSHKDALPAGRTWIIDPIDGTTNFVHGFPVYCVSIALWENMQPKAGLVLEVNSQELFEAIAGGASCNGDPIEVSSESEPGHAMIGTGFPYNDMQLVEHYIDFFKWLMGHTQAIRRPGAASYDLCCLAAGRFDGFYEYSLNPWDVGAGSLIIKEAGGVISDWQGRDDWLFGQRIVAGNPEIHTFLLQAIKEHFTEEEIVGKPAKTKK